VRMAVVAGVALLVSAAPKTRTIHVGDNYYAPATVKVSHGTTVVWRWPAFDQAGDVHDVKLKTGPKGVKKFQSEAASTDYSFKRKLTVAGTYKLVCTLHEEMTMTIKVRK
jgi:plastocyanin